MRGLLKDKVALVTGGSRGIGRAIAERFAEEGAKVFINYSGKSDEPHGGGIMDVVEGIKSRGGVAKSYELDIARIAGHNKMVSSLKDAWGGIDILVNNAGICEFASLDELTPEIWDRAFNVNLRGPFFLTWRVAKEMMKNEPNMYGGRGSIINIGSISGQLTGGNRQHHYCATKAGIHQVTATLAQNLGPYGIRVNAIAPGVVYTDMNEEEFAAASKEELDEMTGAIPLGRGAEPREIAGPAVSLACDRLSSYVTGAIIDVNGGLRVVVAGDRLEN